MPFGFSPVPPCLKGGTGNFFIPHPAISSKSTMSPCAGIIISICMLRENLTKAVELAARDIEV